MFINGTLTFCHGPDTNGPIGLQNRVRITNWFWQTDNKTNEEEVKSEYELVHFSNSHKTKCDTKQTSTHSVTSTFRGNLSSAMASGNVPVIKTNELGYIFRTILTQMCRKNYSKQHKKRNVT